MKTLIMVIGFVLTATFAGQASNDGPIIKNKTENVKISKTNASMVKKSKKAKKPGKKSSHPIMKKGKA